jgi:arylsulfatase A-like enzyme
MVSPGRASDGLFDQLDLFATALTLAGAPEAVPTDRYIDAVDQTSFLLAPDGESNRKFHYYWLLTSMSALRVGEYKYVMRGMSEDDRDVLNPGGFSGSVEAYAYGKLFNLWLDPKETRSYLIRKLVYIELLQQAIARHQRTFREFPNRPPAALRR